MNYLFFFLQPTKISNMSLWKELSLLITHFPYVSWTCNIKCFGIISIFDGKKEMIWTKRKGLELVVHSFIPIELSTNSGPSPDLLIENFEKWSHRHM